MWRIELRNGVWSAALGLLGAGAVVIWPDAQWIGYSLIALGLGLLIWGGQFRGYTLIDLFKGRKHRDKKYRKRMSFSEENVDLQRLSAGAPITGRAFTRCAFHAAQIKIQDRNRINLCSIADTNWQVLPVGTILDASVARFFDCTFDECIFVSSTIFGTQADHQQFNPVLNATTFEQWKALHW